MREFFKGRRRKAGVATLVLACLFGAGWISSLIATHVVQMDLTNRTRTVVFSMDSHLVMLLGQHEKSSAGAGLSWNSGPHLRLDSVFPNDTEIVMDFRIFKTGLTVQSDGHYGVLCLNLPYWVLVIPLTLLSAWLLLSTTKASSKKESVS